MKAQNVLGQFDEVKSVVNTPSAIGVTLTPVTPALVLKDPSLLPSTTSYYSADSSTRPSAFKSLQPLKSQTDGKATQGTVYAFLNRCS